MGSLYEVLGISTGASCLEIKTAYRKLARTCHPDVVAMNQKESSEKQFMMIHLAYSKLSDPNKRAQYDREIFAHRSVVSVSARNKTYSHAGRRWETDQSLIVIINCFKVISETEIQQWYQELDDPATGDVSHHQCTAIYGGV
ncbi:chaperone protein dnaJ 11, chloroplastic-like [Lotus japonicus]|uniref:chaperone protein dnaJ 11, chloroplastic-like n=1 Tax=Lotus japonicus TaxID=34305 RepID=UPI0025892910|nr:chaperone protein dnaJ 11, chloroplastic-like [Lotus japonicus]